MFERGVVGGMARKPTCVYSSRLSFLLPLGMRRNTNEETDDDI